MNTDMDIDINTVTDTITCRLVEARADLGITQKELASATGISLKTIANIESKQHIPSLLYAMNNKKMLDFQTIAVDFDGTLCYSKWPELGQPNQALIEYLQEWKRNDNLPEIIEFYGHNSRKISCDYYIDDRMLLPENAKA